MQRHQVTFSVFKKSALALAARAGIVFAVATSMVTWPSSLVTTSAMAMPPGWFHLRGTVRDNSGGQALRAIDVYDRNMKLTGFAQVNKTLFVRDSQLWKERFPRVGSTDVIKLENKLTGTCIGDSVSPHPTGKSVATMLPCSDPHTLWQIVSRGPNRWIYQRTTKVPGFFSDISTCLGKDDVGDGLLITMSCSNGDYIPEMIWEAYVSG